MLSSSQTVHVCTRACTWKIDELHDVIPKRTSSHCCQEKVDLLADTQRHQGVLSPSHPRKGWPARCCRTLANMVLRSCHHTCTHTPATITTPHAQEATVYPEVHAKPHLIVRHLWLSMHPEGPNSVCLLALTVHSRGAGHHRCRLCSHKVGGTARSEGDVYI